MTEERILVLSPRGRDAQVIEEVLARSNIAASVCQDVAGLVLALGMGAGAAIVTEEALAGADTTKLCSWLDRQPPWSDFPFILLAIKQAGARPSAAKHLLDRLGNVVVMERPINAETLTSAAVSALRGRHRQYEARRYLTERERDAKALQALNESLESRVAERTKELTEARDSFALALNAAEMGSWEFDLVNDTARRSPRHDQIFGYDEPLPAWGQDIFLEHVVPEDREAAEQAFARASSSGTFLLECRIRRPDGGIRWIAAQGRSEYDESGRPVRMAGIIMDITERRRTEELLRQAQKMEAIGQLTGGVAHDFNNLLTVIVGGLDMMIRRPDQGERVKRLAEAAMTAARRGEQLTRQLLAFSRRQMLRPETLNPNRLLLDFKPLAERAGGEAVPIHMDLDPAIDPIRVDPAQFESAILNLVVNARDAMEEGGSITIRSRNIRLQSAMVRDMDLAPGAYVAISVTDTGSGFDAEALQRAFEPFFTTKEVGKGSGLGLSQVYGFTRSAGGNVVIESQPRVGTTVKLYFPRSQDPVGEETEDQSSAVPLRRASKGETVLLVEDDESVLAMAVESLEELRYRVIVARNGAEALQHLDFDQRIDILFSDIVMPGGINGTQLAALAQARRPGLKVLLTSGYVAELDAGQKLGMDLPVLSKPYRRDELARKLRVVLGGVQP
jgi:PAS domain S-box-containing protein